MRRKKCEDVHKRASQKAKRRGPRRDGDGWREGFNWALGSGTCSDNIKGQIYIKCCWERMTRVRKCCWAEGREEDTGRKATTGKKDLEERKGKKKYFLKMLFTYMAHRERRGSNPVVSKLPVTVKFKRIFCTFFSIITFHPILQRPH